jgi:hypothetical protein
LNVKRITFVLTAAVFRIWAQSLGEMGGTEVILRKLWSETELTAVLKMPEIVGDA